MRLCKPLARTLYTVPAKECCVSFYKGPFMPPLARKLEVLRRVFADGSCAGFFERCFAIGSKRSWQDFFQRSWFNLFVCGIAKWILDSSFQPMFICQILFTIFSGAVMLTFAGFLQKFSSKNPLEVSSRHPKIDIRFGSFKGSWFGTCLVKKSCPQRSSRGLFQVSCTILAPSLVKDLVPDVTTAWFGKVLGRDHELKKSKVYQTFGFRMVPAVAAVILLLGANESSQFCCHVHRQARTAVLRSILNRCAPRCGAAAAIEVIDSTDDPPDENSPDDEIPDSDDDVLADSPAQHDAEPIAVWKAP